MKYYTITLFFLVATLHGMEAIKFQFVGVLTERSQTHVALYDPESGKSLWVPIGGMYGEYKVISYDPKTDELALQRGDDAYRLKLKEGVILVGKTSPGETRIDKGQVVISASAPMDEKQLRDIGNCLHQLLSAADFHFEKKGGDSISYVDIVGKKKYVKYVKSVAGEDYRHLVFTPHTKKYTVTTAAGVSVSLERK